MQSLTFLIVVLGYIVFGISAVIWISKKKKAGEKISLLAKIVIAVVVLAGPNIILTMTELSHAPETSVSEASTFYVKTKSANVRECPSTSCKVIDSLSQNTPLTFPGDLFDKYPDWAEVTFSNGEKGYVSKTTLSENIVPESRFTPTDDSSSTGGITIGPWSNIQMALGDSYEFPFCEPPSAISGGTCGALADATTDPRGGTPPYSFIKKSGFLPPGMTLELNGTLKGMPTQEGTYNFRLCAKDLYGGEGCQNLAVAVKKSEETTPVPVNIISPKPATDVPIAINISNGTCHLVRNMYDSAGRIYGRYYTAEFNGTASGPVRSFITYSGQRTIYEQAGVENSWSKLESSWPEDYGRPKRLDGYPATTEWKYTISNGYSSADTPGNKNFVRLLITINEWGGFPEIEKELRVDCL